MKEVRIVTTCCNHRQATRIEVGKIIRCSICKQPFLPKDDE